MRARTTLATATLLATGALFGWLAGSGRLSPDPSSVAAQTPPAKEPAPAAKRPNIVFVLMDNLGYGEPGCYGGIVRRAGHEDRGRL
jgi:hypothetical protein